MTRQSTKSSRSTSKKKNTNVLTSIKENNNIRTKRKHLNNTQKVIIEKKTLVRLFEAYVLPSSKKPQNYTTNSNLTNNVFCGIKLKKQKYKKRMQDNNVNFLITKDISQHTTDNNLKAVDDSFTFFDDLICISDSSSENDVTLSHEAISRKNTQKNTGYKYITIKYKTILENIYEKKWNTLDATISLTAREKKVSFIDNPVDKFTPLSADASTSILRPMTIFKDLKDNTTKEIIIYRRLNLSDENYMFIELDF